MKPCILPALLLSLVLALAACSQDKDLAAGSYTAQSQGTDIILTLNADGKGTWSTDLDEVVFKWSIRKDGELWLHTKEGGVVRGRVEDGTISLTLPGVEELLFRKE